MCTCHAPCIAAGRVGSRMMRMLRCSIVLLMRQLIWLLLMLTLMVHARVATKAGASLLLLGLGLWREVCAAAPRVCAAVGLWSAVLLLSSRA